MYCAVEWLCCNMNLKEEVTFTVTVHYLHLDLYYQAVPASDIIN